MSNALAVLSGKLGERFGMGAGADLVSVLKATAFKGPATDAQLTALMIVADQYALNPFTKEIFAFPDRNNGIVPVVGVDGWSRIINSDKNFDGMDFEQDDESCTCIIYRKDRSHPIRITEYMSECKRDGVGPWKSHPRRMLRHKAMIQCARVAFGFVGIFDPDEADRIVIESESGGHSRRSDVQAALPPSSPERDTLIADMLAVADNGVEAFRAAWKDLPTERRALVSDRMDDFKARAIKADAGEIVEAEYAEAE